MNHMLLPQEMATFPPPRVFQKSAHERLRAGVRAGHKNQVLMAPTGAGKTYLGLRVISEALVRGKRALFVCDRITLIDQTSAVADSYGLNDHGVIQADHWRRNSARFQIASAQTIARRGWPDADVIVIDECHTQMPAWVNHIPDCRASVIGLSATPFSKGLGRLFSNLVNATTMRELTAEGVLVPLRAMTCTPTDMRGAETKGGEWTERAAAERGLKIVGDVVSEWIKFGDNRKTIVFGSTIAHCEEMCRQFRDAGIAAAVFTANTSSAERKAMLADYRELDSFLRVLISVEALAKGFDVPDVACIVDCRPLRKSLSTAIQMWGRGLRASPDTGKTDCLLLDHSGNIVRFQDDFEAVYHGGLDKLNDGEKLDRKVRRDEDTEEPKGCPSCGYRPFRRHCMACGFEIAAQTTIEVALGTMREIRIGDRKLADDSRHLWEQLVTHVRIHSLPDKQRGRAAHLYREITGHWPPQSWQICDTPDVLIKRELVNQIRARNIRYAKGRQLQAGLA